MASSRYLNLIKKQYSKSILNTILKKFYDELLSIANFNQNKPRLDMGTTKVDIKKLRKLHKALKTYVKICKEQPTLLQDGKRKEQCQTYIGQLRTVRTIIHEEQKRQELKKEKDKHDKITGTKGGKYALTIPLSLGSNKFSPQLEINGNSATVKTPDIFKGKAKLELENPPRIQFPLGPLSPALKGFIEPTAGVGVSIPLSLTYVNNPDHVTLQGKIGMAFKAWGGLKGGITDVADLLQGSIEAKLEGSMSADISTLLGLKSVQKKNGNATIRPKAGAGLDVYLGLKAEVVLGLGLGKNGQYLGEFIDKAKGLKLNADDNNRNFLEVKLAELEILRVKVAVLGSTEGLGASVVEVGVGKEIKELGAKIAELCKPYVEALKNAWNAYDRWMQRNVFKHVDTLAETTSSIYGKTLQLGKELWNIRDAEDRKKMYKDACKKAAIQLAQKPYYAKGLVAAKQKGAEQKYYRDVVAPAVAKLDIIEKLYKELFVDFDREEGKKIAKQVSSQLTVSTVLMNGDKVAYGDKLIFKTQYHSPGYDPANPLVIDQTIVEVNWSDKVIYQKVVKNDKMIAETDHRIHTIDLSDPKILEIMKANPDLNPKELIIYNKADFEGTVYDQKAKYVKIALLGERP